MAPSATAIMFGGKGELLASSKERVFEKTDD